MKHFWHSIEKHIGIYRWHPLLALRYLPIVDYIETLGAHLKILEVGSGSLGIAPYLQQPVTGLDISFSPPFHPLLKKVVGDAAKLPFPNNSFDVVLLVDVLEHIPRSKRLTAVMQSFRVAKKAVVIAVPSGVYAMAQDKKLSEAYAQKYGKPFAFLSEHIRYGLPTKEEIEGYIAVGCKATKKQYSLTTTGNMQIRIREFLMYGWMTKNFLLSIFFRKLLLLAIPFMRRMNQPPTYRTLFFTSLR